MSPDKRLFILYNAPKNKVKKLTKKKSKYIDFFIEIQKLPGVRQTIFVVIKVRNKLPLDEDTKWIIPQIKT